MGGKTFGNRLLLKNPSVRDDNLVTARGLKRMCGGEDLWEAAFAQEPFGQGWQPGHCKRHEAYVWGETLGNRLARKNYFARNDNLVTVRD